MKEFILFARVYTWLIFAFPLALPAQDIDSFPNYVVIGAFAHEKNAINFTADANKNKFHAQFEMNAHRNLYYVYVLTTADRELAISEAVRLRAETKYFDTWVYSGLLGAEARPVSERTDNRDLDPITGQRMESVKAEQGIVSNDLSPEHFIQDTGVERQAHTDSPDLTTRDRQTGDAGLTGEEQLLTAAVKDGMVSVAAAPKRVTTEPLHKDEVTGKEFYFHLFRADNGKTVPGEVDVIDFEMSRKMATYQANQAVTVRLPSGEVKRVSFVCQVFGYRKQQKEFDPDSPAEDLYLDDRGNLVVPFELVRLQKGDIAIMYNVFFFKDAAVMRPESRYEVNNLLELLKENPSYEIVIHGHTNGNASGRIIRMNEPGNFYSLSGTKQGFGSAKKLSEERALVMRDYLINSGISADRMQVKAWGGRKPIHDKHSVRANENVRVEIEILSE